MDLRIMTGFGGTSRTALGRLVLAAGAGDDGLEVSALAPLLLAVGRCGGAVTVVIAGIVDVVVVAAAAAIVGRREGISRRLRGGLRNLLGLVDGGLFDTISAVHDES
jgi:hypothetical protein